MGLPARLSIYPVNHRVQILKSYFEKHLENGFYTAIYTYLYPQTRPLCLATDGFVALVLFSSPRRSQAVSKPLPDPRRTFIPHSTLASGVWVGGGEQSLWFLEGMASENPRGQILEAWWLLREEGPGSLGRSRTSGGEAGTGCRCPSALFSTPAGISTSTKHLPRVSHCRPENRLQGQTSCPSAVSLAYRKQQVRLA